MFLNIWLEDEFQQYFPKVDMTKDDLSFVRNPFTADDHTIPLDFQEKIFGTVK